MEGHKPIGYEEAEILIIAFRHASVMRRRSSNPTVLYGIVRNHLTHRERKTIDAGMSKSRLPIFSTPVRPSVLVRLTDDTTDPAFRARDDILDVPTSSGLGMVLDPGVKVHRRPCRRSR